MKITSIKKFKTTDEYISGLPAHIKNIVKELRKTIKQTAAKAEELISYNMPAFKWNGMLVWFAAYSKHIGFYPGAAVIEAFKKELTGYESAKGSVKFPIDKPLPFTLISKMVKFKMQENLKKIKDQRATGKEY